MATLQRITRWTDVHSVTPFTLNREFDNIVNTLNNTASGVLPISGFIVTTPDGLHTYLIGVDNDGALTSTQLT